MRDFKGDYPLRKILRDIIDFMVNIQDFLQVFLSSGIGKMEDNLTSADPLS